MTPPSPTSTPPPPLIPRDSVFAIGSHYQDEPTQRLYRRKLSLLYSLQVPRRLGVGEKERLAEGVSLSLGIKSSSGVTGVLRNFLQPWILLRDSPTVTQALAVMPPDVSLLFLESWRRHNSPLVRVNDVVLLRTSVSPSHLCTPRPELYEVECLREALRGSDCLHQEPGENWR